jgi:sugar phosphate isomerase/epimerase
MRLFRTLWGTIPQIGGPRAVELTTVLDLIKKGGYTGIEVAVKFLVETPGIAQLIAQRDLAVIAIAFTDGPNSEIPSIGSKPQSASVPAHLEALEKQIIAVKAFNPVLLNVHGGRDFFDRAQVSEYFRGVSDLERKYDGFPIAHETHRCRVLYSPWVVADVLAEFPNLKLVADLSHYVCVAEALFDCPQLDKVIKLLAPHVIHIHARVGFEEGPQVPDPRAPEWRKHLEAHEEFWRVIWRSQRERGMTNPTLTPEHGPFPYQHVLPHTLTPTADIFDINTWIGERQLVNFNALGK